MDSLFIQNSILSLVLGFILGLQREMHIIYSNKSKDFGGARTFSMISLFGFLSGWFSAYVPHLLPVTAAILGLLLIAAYVVNSMAAADKGATTEFAALVTFIVGAMIAFIPVIYPVFIAMIVLFVLNIKDKIQEYEQGLTKKDLSAAILFMVMTFAVLPILPDHAIDPYGLVNLHRIWVMVVLVAGISFFGYIAIRFWGTGYGIGIAGLFGGLISSTAVAMSMARRIHENLELEKMLAVGIALASAMMLLRAVFEIWILNPSLARTFILPVAVGTLGGIAYIALLFFTARREPIRQEIEFTNPFSLKEALLMGLLFGATLAFIKIANDRIGDVGVYAVALLSGVADVDAIILSLSSLAKNGLNPSTAHNAVVIAIVTNSLVKAGIVLVLGNARLFRRVLFYYAASAGLFALTALTYA